MLFIKEGRVYPIEFSELSENPSKFGLKFNYIEIEDWKIFPLIDDPIKATQQVRILNLLKKIKSSFNSYNYSLTITSLDSQFMILFAFQFKEEIENPENFLEYVLKKLFFKIDLIDEFDFLPLIKLFNAQLDLELPYVYYVRENNDKISIVKGKKDFIFAFQISDSKRYEDLVEKFELGIIKID